MALPHLNKVEEGDNVEPPHGVLGSRGKEGQNNQGASSRVGKKLGSRGTKFNLGNREQRNNSREHQAEEIK